MNTNQLKRFATEARANLMAGVKRRVHALGFDADGRVKAGMEPELVQGATLWNKQELPESFYGQWTALRDRLANHGIKEVVEEAAYTWFNRLMAIRILTMNRLCDEILTFDASARMPRLLANARLGMVPDMDAQQERHFRKLMEDDNLVYDQFAAVLSAWCHNNPIISACFGSISDYVELLLPANIAQEGGFLSLMNDTSFITKEDYRSAELIGWLYQFYISDRKDEVFAKKGKVEADEIPAATQIFTPNWIVKYMVENTIIPQVDAPQEIIDNAKYLVKESAECDRKVELEDLKVADLACGSGHILNECFNLLFDLYRKEAYSRHEAIEEIFTKNLLGIDLDLRAKQLATFSLLLKACIWGRDVDNPDTYFADAHCLPKVLTVPELANEMLSGDDQMIAGYLHHFFLGSETNDARDELVEAIKLVKDAPSLGSIIKFNLSSSTRRQLEETVAHWKSQSHLPEAIKEGLPVMDFILVLTDTYDAIIANPPYMGAGKFNEILSAFAKTNYPDSKNDLFAIFIEQMLRLTKEKGRVGCITMESWMFLSSYERLRTKLLENFFISSLGHFGWHIIGIAFGTAMAIFEKSKSNGRKGLYSYLTIDDINSEPNIPFTYPKKDNGRYSIIDQSQFEQIPGSPIAYYASEQIRACFSAPKIGSIAATRLGMATADNNLFLRLFWEVDKIKSRLNANSNKSNVGFPSKWFPYAKGGSYRKWNGNLEYLVNWENNGHDIMNFADERGKIRSHNYNLDYIFKKGITWSALSSGKTGFRVIEGALFDNAGSSLFPFEGNNYLYVIALLNSAIFPYLMSTLSETYNYQPGNIGSIPFIKKNSINLTPAKANIAISKKDWDAHETSWDFQQSELLGIDEDKAIKIVNDFCNVRGVCIDMAPPQPNSLEWATSMYKMKWEANFFNLHANEEELNRRFIEIYGLQDELTPDVPLNEVTILQQGEITVKDENLSWNDDVIIKQFISYIVGVWMGRYRLDRPGLNIAHPNPTREEMADNHVNGQTLAIDSDAIIPILPKDAPFPDNLENYIEKFVRMVFGEEAANENLNFIETCLGKSIGAYLEKDFWKDHKKMYQNRPIYWLFSSKKGAFKTIVYVHRMDKYTVEQVRAKYLLPYIGFTERQIESLEKREGSLSTAERKELDRRRSELADMREYYDRLQQRAAEVAAWPDFIDLDDGIIANYAKFGDILTKIK